MIGMGAGARKGVGAMRAGLPGCCMAPPSELGTGICGLPFSAADSHNLRVIFATNFTNHYT